jgi:hypothetical protein
MKNSNVNGERISVLVVLQEENSVSSHHTLLSEEAALDRSGEPE